MLSLRPSRRLLFLLALWLPLAALASWQALFLPLWLGVLGLLAVLVLMDGWWLRRLPDPLIERHIPAAFPLGVWKAAQLHISNRSRTRYRLDIAEMTPEGTETQGLPASLSLGPRERLELEYRLRSLRRGALSIAGCDLRLHGRLGLLDQNRHVSLPGALRVYPNFAEVAKYALLATDNRLSQLGIRLRRRRGEGMEFHQLREYRVGDAPRQVDWKATSRLRKLISREYRDERDQQVLLLLDTGYRMRAQDDGISYFDEALNATLLLAHAVTRRGDAAGLMTFGGNERYLPPAKGTGMVTRIMQMVFDLEPTLCTPDYIRAVQEVATRLHKRSLIIIVTNLRDEDGSDLLEACKLLGQRHLVLVATLREQLFETLHESAVRSVDDAFTIAPAKDSLSLRQRELNRLSHAGVLVLDTPPQQLAVRLINQYLSIKMSGRL